MAQQVKDLVLSLQQLGLLLWRGFDPWPRNFHILQEGERKKKKKKNVTLPLTSLGQLFQLPESQFAHLSSGSTYIKGWL